MLKKILPFITLTLLLAAPAVHAEKGDTIGYIYSTDIRTYINGKEVPSYKHRRTNGDHHRGHNHILLILGQLEDT